jgi:predicted PolB exonuclease-like 3'-5' exonuclease
MTISNVLAFDIETVPDVEFGRRVHALEGLSDKQVGYVMQTRQRELTGSEFLSLEQQRIVAISVAMRTRDGFRSWSLGEPDSDERELVRRFFDGLDRYSPTLVSWNGNGFDLPVLTYRAMRHHVQASRYWENGDSDPSFRWNNYFGRYHWRHVDLMDVLSGFQGRARVGLNNMAMLLGLPGKLGMTGAAVWDAYLEGRSVEIRNYCETDVINTYLVYLRFELLRGRLNEEEHARECALVRSWLGGAERGHLREFLDAWPEATAT